MARYWVGGTGNWSDNTNHWASSSGGTAGASTPTSSDDVNFDANSGTSATATVDVAANAKSITINKSDLTLLDNSGMTVVNAVNLTTGTLNTNGKTESWGSFSSSNSNTRSLTFGTSSVTISGTGNPWDVGTRTNLTSSVASSTITFTGNGITPNIFGLSYGSIVVTGQFAHNFNINTCVNFTYAPAGSYKGNSLQQTQNLTCSGTYTSNGNTASARNLVWTGTVGTQKTITAATVVATNTDFMDMSGAGAGSWDFHTQTDIGDCGGNSGITFPASVQQTWSGTSGGNWSANAWTTRVPLPQDNVVISSAFSASQTVTADMPRLGRSINWTGATGTPTWAFNSIANSIYGSSTLISGMVISGTQSLTFGGRSSYTLTSASQQYTQSITIAAPTGTYTLQDDISMVGDFALNNGDFEANNHNVTANTFSSSNSNTRTLTMGSGTWTLTSTAASTIWNLATTTSLTFSGSSATIVISTTSTNTRTFAGGGKTYGTLTYTVAGSTGQLTVTGANTFTTINFSDASNARTLQFVHGTTTTVTNFTVSGLSGKLMTINSDSAGNAFTLSCASGIIACDWLSLKDSTATGGATFYAGHNSTNVSGNTGWLFNSYFIQPLTDTASLIESVNRFTSRFVSDSLTPAETFIKGYISGGYTDSVSLIESFMRQIAKAPSDLISLIESFSWNAVFQRTLTDSITPSEAFAKAILKIFTSSITPSEAFSWSAVFSRSLSDSVSLAETFTRQIAKLFSGSISPSETFSWQAVFARILTDTVTPIEALSKQVSRLFTASLSLTETFSWSATFGRILTDTISLSETIMNATQKNFNNTITLIDTLNIVGNKIRTFGESISPVSTLVKQTSRVYTETTSLIEAFSKQTARVYTETISFSESILKQVNKGYAEALTLAEQFIKQASKLYSEAVTLSEAFMRLLGKVFSEALFFFYLLLENGYYLLQEDGSRIILDMASFIFPETLSRSAGRFVGDTVSYTEALNRFTSRTLTDILSVLDTVVRQLAKSRLFRRLGQLFIAGE